MKEAFEKIKERLEEAKKSDVCEGMNCCDCDGRYGYKSCDTKQQYLMADKCMDIVSEVEAEYGNEKTNADRIRSMSDEELADFLEEFEACDVCKYYDKNRCTFENPCVHEFAGIMIWEWLKSPTTD